MSGLVEVNNRLSSLVLCPAPPPPEKSWLGLTYEETMLLYGIFSFFLVLLAVTLTWHRMSRPLVISLRDLDPRLHQADGRLSFRVEDDVPNDGWTTRDNGWPQEENWDTEDNAVIPELLEAPAVDAVLQALAEAPAPLAPPEDASLETPQMSPEESWPTAAQPAASLSAALPTLDAATVAAVAPLAAAALEGPPPEEFLMEEGVFVLEAEHPPEPPVTPAEEPAEGAALDLRTFGPGPHETAV